MSIALILQGLQRRSRRGRPASPASPSALWTSAFRIFIIVRRGSVQPGGFRSRHPGMT